MLFNTRNVQSIEINNGVVRINGKKINTDEKEIIVRVEGNCGSIKADYCTKIEVAGGVNGDIETMNGDVQCGDVHGSVTTMSGDVRASKISRSISTMSGDVNC